ncbi:hypothetical protein [uncultured Photobacterium sp.]|uniref:hypothetical protein n=1 Tax=uncultured Photobacterium sp. TaxID=173973 RepID=UPI0026155583|nr:hypothetical protein [uncultured Photobacterium sp.]
MKNIILAMLTMVVVVGCGGSDGSDPEPNLDAGAGSAPISVDASTPSTEVPEDADELQACVAINSIQLMDVAGHIVELTTKSMNNPEELSSEQCIPADSSIPVDSEGYPQFIVIDLYDVAGVDLVNLITEQLIPVGEYVSMGLSVLQGSYGDFFDTPYSYVGNQVDKQKLEILDGLTFEGLNINIDVPKTFTMTFDLRKMIQLVEDVYVMKNEGLTVVENTLASKIWGDIDPSSCLPSTDNAYVYLYDADTEQYGDLGSEHEPMMTAKVTEDNTYSMPYVPEGTYDVVLVCDALLDLPNQIDLDIDLDASSPKYTDQQLSGDEDKYLSM